MQNPRDKGTPFQREADTNPNSHQEIKPAPWTLEVAQAFGEISPLIFSSY